ncbi:RES domain-containing protein [Candidatus Solirubrobacter pratensis]|uniref:RES domain-containing protein n=1 Tax=Candidatus Solirubrobacter pratensis TaxID=1298857 RepID=UPI00040028CE|nr:RES domain-containing protein [Candidatus Solirubrobacter pratensis]
MALDVEATLLAGEWIRHAPHSSSLLGRAAEPTDGRWQHGTVVRGLYLADRAATATAEWYRFLAERGLPPARAIPHDHHIWRIALELADLSSRERLAAVGLPLPRPWRRTWSAFQDVGDALCRAGWFGLRAPSAARPGAQIVCVFDHGTWPPAGCEPVRTVEIAEVPPPPTGMTT